MSIVLSKLPIFLYILGNLWYNYYINFYMEGFDTMTDKTLELIHQIYQKAVANATDILGIVQNIYDDLSVAEVAEEDVQAFDNFIDGVRGCLQYRRQTFKLTNFVTDINFVIMYIILWLNDAKSMDIDINLNARRKALESDLAKLLRKSNSNVSVNIRDRFGLRGIILNDVSPEELVKRIYVVYDAIVGIIAKKNRRIRNEFIQWVTSTPKIDPHEKKKIMFILDVPFAVDFVKNFIESPKENGYQSLQFSLCTLMYSEVLPGAQLEIQLRTTEMHQIAIHGTASHDDVYVNTSEREKYNNIFTVDDFSNVHIKGFTSYNSADDDIDGVHYPKFFVNRRISSTLVP